MISPFIGSLPLVAAALGRKYGVKVLIGGDKAASDGQNIYLPALPIDSPPDLVKLARGFLDHESAHVRATDFDLIRSSRLKPLEMRIWNMIEDHRVERLLSDQYPGCRQNIEWLVRRFFDLEAEDEGTVDRQLLNWLLLTIRSWSIPELSQRVQTLAGTLERDFPGLTGRLSPILNEAKEGCPDTGAALRLAREIVQVINDFGAQNDSGSDSGSQPGDSHKGSENRTDKEPKSDNSSEQIPESAEDSDKIDQSGKNDNPVSDECPVQKQADCQDTGQDKPATPSADSASRLKSLLTKNATELPSSLGEMIASELSQLSVESVGRQITVARESPLAIRELVEESVLEAKRTMIKLKSRLQSLLQGLTLSQFSPGRRGRLEPTLVHRLFLNSPKVFRRSSPRVGLDTAVHLLMDASGSMTSLINLASLTTYSLCDALANIPGINAAATAFPGSPLKNLGNNRESWSTVAPLLRHGQPMSRKFQLSATGNTPLAQALWWVIQEMAPLRESRKIIFVVTDGYPDSVTEAQAAIRTVQNLGLEIYGLGLGSASVHDLLPGRSAVIYNLLELPQKLFRLLGQAMSSGYLREIRL